MGSTATHRHQTNLNSLLHPRPNSTSPNSIQLNNNINSKHNLNIIMDATTQNKRTSTDNRRPSGEMFQKIHTMKRDPANDRAAARRASFEEQSIPKGAGILGDMWNKYTRGGK